MYRRAIAIIAAGMGALSAQTPPPSSELTPAPRQLEAALNQYLKISGRPAVCAIGLLVVPLPKNLEPMPVLRPRIETLEPMPVKIPAPPCEEDKR